MAEYPSRLLGLPIKLNRSLLTNSLNVPVDGASLAFFRIVYGAVGVLSMVRILANGWVTSLYAGPANHFTYPGLGWVRPPAVAGMYVLVVAVGLGALAIMIGWHTRVAMAAFLVGFGWIEFIDVTTYLNHYWFVSLAGLLMLFAPISEEFAVRAHHRPVASGWVWMGRFQVAVVYVFAGLAKIDRDWLVHALPLRLWLPARTDVPVIGPLLAHEWVAYVFSWAGAAFDCLIVVFLVVRRTRLAAWLVVVAFHVTTWRLFSIGVFPWLMIGATTLFFEPAWPRRFVLRRDTTRSQMQEAVARPRAHYRFSVGLAAVWVAIQLLLPLRHLLIAGDARWTGEGYRWSWNVLLTERGGDASFRVTNRATGTTWVEDGRDRYSPLQWKAMSTDAELVRQAAHAIASAYRAQGTDVEVRADVFVSLDGRQAARLVDPDVDLARQPWRLGHQPWILPAPDTPPP